MPSLLVKKIYKPFLFSKKRYNILLGGRAAGRSFFSSQYALIKLLEEKYFRCAIMRDVLTDVRSSIYQEIVDRIDGIDEYASLIRQNSSFMSFEYNDNLVIAKGFKKSSSQRVAKLKSLANFNTVIIEEADEVGEEDFMQLDDSLRTKDGDIRIFLLLNPPSKNHWIIKRWFNLLDSTEKGFFIPELKKEYEENTLFLHGTYLNNLSNLSKSSIRNYENYKNSNPEHYFSMIKGLVPDGNRGRIYRNWKIITDIEFDSLPYPSFFGLDFGYSNDPTALLEVKKHNNKIYLKELLYERALTNQDLFNCALAKGLTKADRIVADSSEPREIEELRRLGLFVIPAKKGKDSVLSGIKNIQSNELFFCESSKNLSKELQEYSWQLDKDKEPTDRPLGKNDHLLDAMRYALEFANINYLSGVV